MSGPSVRRPRQAWRSPNCPITTNRSRAPALRFGDPRVQALAGALSLSLFAATGFTNKSLRAIVARLLGTPYTASQMTYDLRRLHAKELIHRIQGTRTSTLTP
jgi:hypothetical protein